MSAPRRKPTAAKVARSFVKQYYGLLSERPEELFRFYKDDSRFTRANGSEVVSVALGKEAINAKIASFEFSDVVVDLDVNNGCSVDHQASHDGGVLVVVVGRMGVNGEPVRPFTQTFFLAKQADGYYVLNDAFRFLATPLTGDVDPAEDAALQEEQTQLAAAKAAAEQAEADAAAAAAAEEAARTAAAEAEAASAAAAAAEAEAARAAQQAARAAQQPRRQRNRGNNAQQGESAKAAAPAPAQAAPVSYAAALAKKAQAPPPKVAKKRPASAPRANAGAGNGAGAAATNGAQAAAAPAGANRGVFFHVEKGTTEEEVRAAMSVFGDIANVQTKDVNRGFIMLDFATGAAAAACIKAGEEGTIVVKGRKLKPVPRRSGGRGGGRGAGRGGRGGRQGGRGRDGRRDGRGRGEGRGGPRNNRRDNRQDRRPRGGRANADA